MTRTISVAIVLCCAVIASAARAQDVGPPHHMTKPDGELDPEVCGACHNEDFSLQRSKLETCTLCHAQTVHAGSDEHVRAAPAAVKRALELRAKDLPALPLGDDGHMYCGTCHLFHDPKVTSEDWLKQGWLPRTSGLPSAVQQAVISRWAALTSGPDATSEVGQFAAKGTRLLRMPVDNGQLCRGCHGTLR